MYNINEQLLIQSNKNFYVPLIAANNQVIH